MADRGSYFAANALLHILVARGSGLFRVDLRPEKIYELDADGESPFTYNGEIKDVCMYHMWNYRNAFDPSGLYMKGRDVEGNWARDFDSYDWGGPPLGGKPCQWK